MRGAKRGAASSKPAWTLASTIPTIGVFAAPPARPSRLSRLRHWLLQRASHFDAPLLLRCVLVDLVFIAAHLVHNHASWLPDYHLSIEHDRGYAEIFQYFKEIGILLLLGRIGFAQRSPLFIAWSLLFLYVLADDALSLHETWGLAMAQSFSLEPMMGLRGADLGELAATTLAVSGLLMLVGITYRPAPVALRAVSVDLVALLAALACCGVVFDMLHIAAPLGVPRAIYALVEDGGEMLVMSLVLARVAGARFIFGQASRCCAS